MPGKTKFGSLYDYKVREWEDIFQAIGHLTLVLDPHHIILHANQAAIRAIGMPEEQLKGRACYEVFHQTSQPPPMCPLQKMCCSKEFATESMEVEALNGVYLVSCTPVFGENDEVENIIHIATDITRQKRAEAALRESEAKYRQIFESVTDAIVVTDMDTKVVDANTMACQMYGYPLEELTTKYAQDLIHPHYHHVLQQFIHDVQTQGTFLGETIDLKKDGTTFHAEVKGTSLVRYGQEHLVAIIRDISDRKEADILLKNHTNFIQNIVNTAPNLIYIYDLNTHRNVYCNTGIEKLLGYDANEIQEMGDAVFPRLMHPEDFKKVAQHHMRLRDCPEGDVYEIEYRIQHRDGCYRILHSWDAVFERNSAGEGTQIIGVASDITARKHVEEALRQSKTAHQKTSRLLETVLNAIPDILGVQDAQHGILRYNEAGYRFFDLSPQHVKGKKCFEVIGHAVPCTTCATNEVYQTKRPAQVEKYIEELGIWFDCRAYPVVDEQGNLIQVIEHLRDITERKHAEQAIRQLNQELEQRVLQRTSQLAAANKDLNDFAYIVSHDLRAPLRGITQLAQWLVQDYAETLDTQGREMIELLVNRVKRMDALITGILHYSRTGRIEEEKEPLNLNELVADIIDSLAPPSSLRIILEQDLPSIVSERVKVTQVFQNLLSNAIKYLNKPQGVITIQSHDDEEYWHFSIADNGKGIAPEHHERVFQMFQTLMPSDEKRSTGIGLTLTKKIITTLGGTIWLESALGIGSTFHFTLPKQAHLKARNGEDM